MIAVAAPPVLWARPVSGQLHALEAHDVAAAERGYTEALCGFRLPADGLAYVVTPSGQLCLPCVIGATADAPDHHDAMDWS